MSLRYQAIGSLLDQSGYDRAGDNIYPVLSITMKQGLIDQSDKFKKRVASQDTSKYRVAYKNELVVGFPIDEGVLGFQTKYPAGIVSPAYDIWRLKSETQTHIPYLERYLRSPQARALYASKMQGAVARRRSLTKSDFLKLEIPIPSLDDQVRIALLLSKVESLIAQRKENLQQLDELLKSVFLDMFGDPVRNDMGWKKVPFSELLTDIESGWSPKCEAREAFADEWGVLKLGAVTSCIFKDGENKALPVNIEPKKQHEVKVGDLLFSRKNTYDLVAACAYVFQTRPKVLLPDLIFRFVFSKSVQINSIYIWQLLTCDSQRKKIQSLAFGASGSMPNISKTNLKKVELPIPPIDIQNQFAAIVEKFENIKSRYRYSLAKLENLYGALSQQAFKGKLDLSRIPLNHEKDEGHEKQRAEFASHFQQGLPEHVEEALENLNAFNENAASLNAVQEEARFAGADFPELNAVKGLTEQLAALRSPWQELKLMPEISKTMEQAWTATKFLDIDKMESFKRNAELAQVITMKLPKIDLGWLEQHSEVFRKTTASFESMRAIMEKVRFPLLQIPDPLRTRAEAANPWQNSIGNIPSWQKAEVLPKIGLLGERYRNESFGKTIAQYESTLGAIGKVRLPSVPLPGAVINKQLETLNRLQSTIPDLTTWQKHAINPGAFVFDDDEETASTPSFSREDIRAIFSNAAKLLSFDSLLLQLGAQQTVDSVGYEAIKAILFELLAENQLTQIFDEAQKKLLFSWAE
jgi:restriction endonuclease S subunit